MSLKILVTSDYFGKNIPGGAEKSLRIIIEGLLEIKNISIKILAREVKIIKKKNLSITPLEPIISHLQNKVKKIIMPFGADYFLYTLQIFRTIKKFKPHIIITQRNVAFPTIFCAIKKQIPVIHILRDPTNICPKHVDIIKYGTACPALINKKTCYKCINYWRTLRVLIGDKPKGWEKSFKSVIYTIFYKFRYYLIRLNFMLMNRTSINVVASPLMQNFLSYFVNPEKIKIINITPIEKKKEYILNFKKIKGNLMKQIELIKNLLLFITPTYKGYHKGENFIKKLIKKLPESYKIIIVGKKIDQNEINERILNLDQVELDYLYFLYHKSKITLVPSFYSEAFGRIIIESFINKTPVISSPNCGANYFFKEKKFLKVVPLKLHLWKKAIKTIIEKPPKIDVKDINLIYKHFSADKSKKDFLNLIRSLIKEDIKIKQN